MTGLPKSTASLSGPWWWSSPWAMQVSKNTQQPFATKIHSSPSIWASCQATLKHYIAKLLSLQDTYDVLIAWLTPLASYRLTNMTLFIEITADFNPAQDPFNYISVSKLSCTCHSFLPMPKSQTKSSTQRGHMERCITRGHSLYKQSIEGYISSPWAIHRKYIASPRAVHRKLYTEATKAT